MWYIAAHLEVRSICLCSNIELLIRWWDLAWLAENMSCQRSTVRLWIRCTLQIQQSALAGMSFPSFANYCGHHNRVNNFSVRRNHWEPGSSDFLIFGGARSGHFSALSQLSQPTENHGESCVRLPAPNPGVHGWGLGFWWPVSYPLVSHHRPVVVANSLSKGPSDSSLSR